jgi:hypothetical protein
MLDLITEAITALQAETSSYSANVQIWMKLMGLSFLASIVFVYSKTGARWILAALILNILGLVVGKIIFPEQSRTVIGTYVHILFWPALLWAAGRSILPLILSQKVNALFDWIYIVWLSWACLLLCISLVFDFRSLFFMAA